MSEIKTDPTGAAPDKLPIPDDSASYALAERAVWHLLEKKGDDLVIMDLRGLSDVCDFYVLCSGKSDVQVTALAKHVCNALLAVGQKPKGLEGMNEGRWALLDFFDIVVHVFKSDARQYFNLERLWGDAPKLELEPEHFLDAAVAARHTDLKFTTAAGPDGTP